MEVKEGLKCISNLDLGYIRKLVERIEVICEDDLQIDEQQLVEIMGGRMKKEDMSRKVIEVLD